MKENLLHLEGNFYRAGEKDELERIIPSEAS